MSVIHHRQAAGTKSEIVAADAPSAAPNSVAARALAVVRIAFGLTFLWAFADKLLALGFATGRDPVTNQIDQFGDAAWINGGSPTAGFLGYAADGPFQSFYNNIAGSAWADTLFMMGLLGIGVALTFGVATRAAAAAGVVLYVMMWSVVLPPENNPILDYHLEGAFTLIVLALLNAGDTWGLGGRLARTEAVKKYPVLR